MRFRHSLSGWLRLAVFSLCFSDAVAAKSAADRIAPADSAQAKAARQNGARQNDGAYAIPGDLRTLTDQEGRPFSFAPLAGKTVLANFIFTSCPMKCPLQMQQLVAIQRALSPDLRPRVRFVSVTVDPDRDSAAVLKRYAEAMGADPSAWSFVTGSAPELERLYRYFGAGVKLLDDGQFDHQVGVYLLDGRGRVMQRYTGDLDKARLLRETAAVAAIRK